MASIRDLQKRTTTVDIDGVQIPVHAIGIGTLLDAIGAQSLMMDVVAAKDRQASIVAAILAAGRDAITKILAEGLRETPEAIADAGLSGVDEISILIGIAECSLPDTQMGKAKAAAAAFGQRLGLAVMTTETAPSEKSGES